MLAALFNWLPWSILLLPHLEVVIGYVSCTASRVSKNANFAAGVGRISKLHNRLLINVERDLVAVCYNAKRVNQVETSGKPCDLAPLHDTRVGAGPVDRDLKIVIPLGIEEEQVLPIVGGGAEDQTARRAVVALLDCHLNLEGEVAEARFGRYAGVIVTWLVHNGLISAAREGAVAIFAPAHSPAVIGQRIVQYQLIAEWIGRSDNSFIR